MKTNSQIFIVIATISTLVIAFCSGGSLEPSQPPSAGGTMKTLDEVEPRIPLILPPYEISQPGSYYLTHDLNIESFANGINITADDVTIDLMGYKIELGYHFISGEYYGIKVDGAKNVKICNGTIKGFNTYGISGKTSETEGIEISSMRIIGNESAGIYLEGKNHTITDCYVSDSNSVGISCSSTDNLIISKTTVTNNNGIGIRSGNSAIIENCIVTGNDGTGINVSYFNDNCKIKDNIVRNNSGGGIGAGNNCVVSGNSVSSNSGSGIYCVDSNTIISNSIYANGARGIDCNEGNVVKNNSIKDNQGNGLETGNGNTVINNSVQRNIADGLRIGYGCTITGNTAYKNGDYGIYHGRYCLIDQNTCYNNDQNGGGNGNMNDNDVGCVFGRNVAP